MGRDDCERTRQLPVEGQEVYHWPEFKALCKRLGVSWECETTKITITLAPGELALVCQDYQGTDRHLQQPPAGIPPEGTPHPESEASGG